MPRHRPAPQPPIDFPAAQASPAFGRLRRDHRRFVFPMAGLFLVWYLAYALTAMYAPAFMSQRLWGNITVGIVWGILQFVSTFAITGAYIAFAGRRLDPQAADLRGRMEHGDFAPAGTGGRA
ncbi:hypothetical protein A5N15_01300 [Rothia kristinae]|uniref:Clumping factor B n=1 Tax=Rothia kristinae TaxID=37923 RepID=A0A657IVU8_9MICC|nr:hypothetical protein A5N15_01300 [Rothia kristinae]